MGTGRRLAFSFMLLTPGFAAGVKEDTARLVSHLAPLRGGEFTAAEFVPIQAEYLAWIDSRVRARGTLEQINEELRGAKLLFKEPESLQNNYGRSEAGYLDEVEVESIPEAIDLLALRLGIYTGSNCGYDETLVLYQRKPFRRLGWLNAEQSFAHGHSLGSVRVGNNPAQGRIMASAWTASSCVSAWNGTRFRIDLLQSQTIARVLNREALTRNDVEVDINVQGDTATFRYSTDMRDTLIGSRTGVASYRIESGRAIRRGPIASHFGGFIDEWLLLNDDDAARVSAPEAARMHHEVAARFRQDSYDWEHVADCPNGTREIAIQEEKSERTTVFLLRASTIADMRMLLVSDKLDPSCREIDISKDLSAITTGPPQ
jgi:hypothetical protein